MGRSEETPSSSWFLNLGRAEQMIFCQGLFVGMILGWMCNLLWHISQKRPRWSMMFQTPSSSIIPMSWLPPNLRTGACSVISRLEASVSSMPHAELQGELGRIKKGHGSKSRPSKIGWRDAFASLTKKHMLPANRSKSIHWGSQAWDEQYKHELTNLWRP